MHMFVYILFSFPFIDSLTARGLYIITGQITSIMGYIKGVKYLSKFKGRSI